MQKASRATYLAGIPVKMKVWHDNVSERLYSDESPIHMARIITELNKALPADGHLIADGGFTAIWGGLLFNTNQAGRPLCQIAV